MPNNVHPTAQVDPQAELAGDIEIGAFAVIGAGVRLGAGCKIASHAVIKCGVELGQRCRVAEHAVLGGDPQDLNFQPDTSSRVVIGDDNVLREFVTIHRGTAENSETRIGNSNYLMAGSHLGHDCWMGDHCVLANNVLLAGHVRFGSRIVVGGATVFHQFVRVGDYAMIQGSSKFGQDILPCALAAEYNGVAGINQVGLRRNGFDAEARRAVKILFDRFFQEGLTPKKFVETVQGEALPEPAQTVSAFVQEGTKRGYCRFIRASEFKGRKGKET
jgi:UDP-N-acetylglucosamine acyltransferase